MCGIAGIVDLDKPVQRGQLAAMLEAITFRGPDDHGRYDDERCSMGMRRLSIIDVGGGHQPISNEDGTVWVVFNGEIYNFVELRAELEAKGHCFATRTDTEVLVHLYEEYGERFVGNLNGMFAFALWDTRRQRLMLARDHAGIKPLYWSQQGRRLVFASEVKCFLRGAIPQPTVDRSAIAAFMHLGYIPREQSPFREIRRLCAGQTLVFDAQSGARIGEHWSMADAFENLDDRPDDQLIPEIRETLRDAVRLHLRSDVPLGSFLSGGLDSSAIAVFGCEFLDGMDTFTVSFEGHSVDESGFARLVADQVRSRHHEMRVDPSVLLKHFELLSWHLDEPNVQPSMLPSFMISSLAREHVKVMLSGDGGDELFAGYRHHIEQPPLDSTGAQIRRWVPRSLRAAGTSSLALFNPALAQRVRDRLIPGNNAIGLAYAMDYALPRIRNEVAPWIADAFPAAQWIDSVLAEVPNCDWINQRLYFDLTTSLPDQILAVADRSSMAVSLEVRVPFLDKRLVRMMAAIPGHRKAPQGERKALLRRALREQLPRPVLERAKLGWAMPVRRWIHTPELRSELDRLPTGYLAREGFIEGARIGRFIVDEHLREENFMFLWSLAMLELWFAQYVKGERLPAERASALTRS